MTASRMITLLQDALRMNGDRDFQLMVELPDGATRRAVGLLMTRQACNQREGVIMIKDLLK